MEKKGTPWTKRKDDGASMKGIAVIAAASITLALYLAKAPPFSLLETEPDAAETPAAEIVSPANAGGQTLVISLEPFDQAVEEDPETHAMREGANTWTKTLTLINPSAQPVVVYLFLQGLTACSGPEAQDCVRFPASATIEENGSLAVDITFVQIDLAGDEPRQGKMILAGGDIQQEFPFVITGEWQKAAFDYSSLGHGSIVVLLGAGVWYALFLVLHGKVFPALRPERFLPLRMDITDENKALWAVFSSRLIEMQERGYGLNLSNPLAEDEGKIDLPTNLGKEGDFFKAVVDLLAWILPRRGSSIRLQSLKEDSKCKGIAIAIVKNSNDRVLSEHIFWAGEYGLGTQTCNLEYLLMTPAILWLSDWTRKRDPAKVKKGTAKQPTPEIEGKELAWNVRACCLLADMLWSADLSAGKRLYMDALLHDPSNRQAQSGLGRIWIEESQKEDNTEHEAEDCLTFAVAFLENVCRDAPESKDPLWFAAKYNLAVARMYQGHKENAAGICTTLFAEIDKRLPPRAKDCNAETPPGPAGGQEADDFLLWLGRFKAMALVFQQSVILENRPPKEETELDQTIAAAIDKVKTGLGIAEVAPAHAEKPAPSEEITPPLEWLLVTLNYRAQYNAACYFSRCYRLAGEFGGREKYAKMALDYLRLALGHGGGLVRLASKDRVLDPLREKFEKEFEDIAPKEKKPETPEKIPEVILRLVAEKTIIAPPKRRRGTAG